MRLFRRSRLDAELDDELRSHIQHRADDLERAGLSRAEAERRARVEFGAYQRVREESRDASGGTFFESVWQDLRYATRVLRKSKGFTIVAIVTLALGIGANAVVFGVLNALVLRPLNLPQESSLYSIEQGDNGFGSYMDYLDMRDQNRSFESLAAYCVTAAAIDTGGNPSRAWIFEVTGNYFDMLGIQPALGRLLHAADEHGPNSAPYVVLTDAYWRAHFQADPNVIGRTVEVNRQPYTIIGVTPPEFRGTLLFFPPDFFVPIVNHDQINSEHVMTARSNRWVMEVLGHVKAGVSPAQATEDLNAISAYLANTYPKDDGKMVFSLARPSLFGNFLGRPIRAFITGLMLLAGLILLAACANLGSLFAARAADRSREVALRLALGAGRARILRQLFTESLLLAIAGGTLGLAASLVLLRALGAWQPFSRFPVHVPVAPDASVYAVALVLAVASGLLFGAVPIRQVLHTDPYEVVKSGSIGKVTRRLTARDVSLVVQIAICAVLVTSSFVAVRGLLRTLHSNFGIEPEHALLINAELRMGGYQLEQMPDMRRKMIDRLGSMPGVESAAYLDKPPLAMDTVQSVVFADDATELTPDKSLANPFMYGVSPGYFRTAGTTIVAGRDFSWHDDEAAPRVAIVNREFARRVFGAGANPLDRYFKRRDGTRYQVVGVVEDGKYLNLTEDQRSAMFFPAPQWTTPETWLVLRSTGDPLLIADAARSTLRDLDAGLPVYMQSWEKSLDGVLFPARMATVSLGVLGVMGAMLSVTGIFGMAAYSVSKRLRELGIRIALGAERKEVLRAALGRAVKLLVVGSAAGLVLGLLAARVLSAIVYQATPRDPLVLTGVAVAMLLVGLLATWIPAQRALSINPLMLLREE
ncbi:MAG TPA: ABC transporter permease [Vicinamibacterales bacterium]|nr:ABC transporter permease [Vicinamibacterales bacterium]